MSGNLPPPLEHMPFNPSLPDFGSEAEERFVPCEGGELRVLIHRATNPSGARPIVMMAGFGAGISPWQDFFASTCGETDVFAIETLDKTHTRLAPGLQDLHPAGLGRQLAAAIRALELEDFVLVGISWHAGVMIQALHDGLLPAATFIAFDPVSRVAIPRWLVTALNWLLPTAALGWIRTPLLSWRLRRMTQPHQRARLTSLVQEADAHRWKMAAYQGRDFDLIEVCPVVHDEVFVVNGSSDAIHDGNDGRDAAQALPNGRLLQLNLPEHQRERFAGAVALAFARVTRESGLPDVLAELEQEVARE